jgi:DNA-binding response OmpR family regulator
MSEKKALGKILLEQRAIAASDLERVLAEQRPGSPPLASTLIDQGLVTEVEALKALSTQRGVPGLDLTQICIRLTDLHAIPREVASVHKMLPVLERQDRIFVAMANPEDKKALEELEFVTGKRVFAYIALESMLVRAIRDAYDARERGESHYVGPACPAEVLRKAGLDPAKYAPEPAPQPTGPIPRPLAPPAPKTQAPAPPAAQPPARPAPPPLPTRSIPVAPPTPQAPVVRAAPSRPVIPRDEPPVPGPAIPPAPTKPAAMFRTQPTNTEQRFRPSTTGMQAVRAPVIVDEKLERVVTAELNEADFGDVAAELSIVAELPKAPPPKAPSPPKKKLLVVDDELEIRKMLRKVFEDRGFQVLEADRGTLALQLVKQESPDLLVLDAMLPEVHGFDIARRIRNSSRYGHIPIVMVSAVYRGWRFAEDAKSSYGVDAYLEKPFKIPVMIETVERCLSERRAQPDPQGSSDDSNRLLEQGLAAYKAGDLEKATELLRDGVKIDPLAYRLRYQLGLLLGKRGQIYDAIEQLEHAVQIQPKHFASAKNLAILYQQAGFRNKALEAWERALSLAPDEETKKTIKEHIVSLL